MMIDSGTTVAHGPWAHTQCEAVPGSNGAVWEESRFAPLLSLDSPPLAIACHVREACHCHATRDGPAAVGTLRMHISSAKFDRTNKNVEV